MANIVVTKDKGSIVVSFGDYANALGGDTHRIYEPSDIVEVNVKSDHITVLMREANSTKRFDLTNDTEYSGNSFFIVDSVNGVSSFSELIDLALEISALRFVQSKNCTITKIEGTTEDDLESNIQSHLNGSNSKFIQLTNYYESSLTPEHLSYIIEED